MTIYQLYQWAVENHVEDCELSVRDSDGWYTNNIEPEIITHKYENGYAFKEVEL